MPGNTVTLTFGGDSDQLERSFDRIGSASETMERKVRNSSDALDDNTSRVGALGERADGAETSLIGMHDVIDGTATIMQGPGEQGIVAYIQGWADLAGGIAPLLIQMASLKFATIQQTAAQWAQNAAWLASPITWIVAGIALLIAAVVLIATKTDWFQKGWSAAWGGIKAVAGAVANWFSGPFVGFFVGAWNALIGLPAKLKEPFSKVAGWILAPFKAGFNAIADAWNNTVGKLAFRLPGWIPGLGGNGFDMPDIPKFHTGGVVPGGPGSEMLAILQGGEKITPRGGSAPVAVQITIGGSGTFASMFLEAIRTGAITLSVQGGRVAVAGA